MASAPGPGSPSNSTISGGDRPAHRMRRQPRLRTERHAGGSLAPCDVHRSRRERIHDDPAPELMPGVLCRPLDFGCRIRDVETPELASICLHQNEPTNPPKPWATNPPKRTKRRPHKNRPKPATPRRRRNRRRLPSRVASRNRTIRRQGGYAFEKPHSVMVTHRILIPLF